MTDLRIDEMVEVADVAEVVADVVDENVVENVVEAGKTLNKKAIVGVFGIAVATLTTIGIMVCALGKKKAENDETDVEETDDETVEEETTEDSETEN